LDCRDRHINQWCLFARCTVIITAEGRRWLTFQCSICYRSKLNTGFPFGMFKNAIYTFSWRYFFFKNQIWKHQLIINFYPLLLSKWKKTSHYTLTSASAPPGITVFHIVLKKPIADQLKWKTNDYCRPMDRLVTQLSCCNNLQLYWFIRIIPNGVIILCALTWWWTALTGTALGSFIISIIVLIVTYCI